RVVRLEQETATLGLPGRIDEAKQPPGGRPGELPHDEQVGRTGVEGTRPAQATNDARVPVGADRQRSFAASQRMPLPCHGTGIQATPGHRLAEVAGAGPRRDDDLAGGRVALDVPEAALAFQRAPDLAAVGAGQLDESTDVPADDDVPGRLDEETVRG